MDYINPKPNEKKSLPVWQKPRGGEGINPSAKSGVGRKSEIKLTINLFGSDSNHSLKSTIHVYYTCINFKLYTM